MKKIILVTVFLVVFVATFMLIFFTGNDKDTGLPAETTGKETVQTTPNKPVEEAKPYDYDLAEYVTLGDFPKIEEGDTAKIQKLIDDAKNTITNKYAEKKEVSDRPAKNGDTVNVDYVGRLNGVAFQGGTANGADITLGAGGYIPGFEEGLVGHSVGEEFVVDVTFPENYGVEDLNGQKVQFTFKVNKITESVAPELTDAMVADLKRDDYKTVAEFNVYITKLATQEVLLEKYVESCEIIKYTEAEVIKYKNDMISNYTLQAQYYYNMSLEDFAKANGFKDVSAFESYVLEYAQEIVKLEMIVYQTIRQHKIEFTDDEYNALALVAAEQNGYSTVAEFSKAAGENAVELSVFRQKMIDMLYEGSQV